MDFDFKFLRVSGTTKQGRALDTSEVSEAVKTKVAPVLDSYSCWTVQLQGPMKSVGSFAAADTAPATGTGQSVPSTSGQGVVRFFKEILQGDAKKAISRVSSETTAAAGTEISAQIESVLETHYLLLGFCWGTEIKGVSGR